MYTGSDKVCVDRHKMDGCAAHASVAMYTGHNKVRVDKHTHIYDAHIHLGHTEVLSRVSS